MEVNGTQTSPGAYTLLYDSTLLISSPFWLHWVSSSLILLPYMVFGYFSYCFLLHNLISFFQLGPPIQLNRKETLSVKMEEAKWSFVCISIGSVYIGLCVAGYERGLSKVYFNIEEYGWPYLLLSSFGMWLVNDAWQYWTHRALHTKMGFQLFHRIHHKFNAPSTYATMAFHPVESCVQFHPSLLTFVFPVYFPLMVGVTFLFFTISVMEHSGFYIVPYEKFGWLLSTPLHHDLHHSRFRFNFAVYLTMWDRLCGTFLHEVPTHITSPSQTSPSSTKAKAT